MVDVNAENNWVSPTELRAIANFCEALNPLWDALVNGPVDGISVDTDSIELSVYDCNGEKLGLITWGDSGPAFYPNKGE